MMTAMESLRGMSDFATSAFYFEDDADFLIASPKDVAEFASNLSRVEPR